MPNTLKDYYKGTLPLNLDMFPIVESPTEKGKVSNIITRYYESDGKYILVPSMMRGKMLDDSDINKMIRQGKHFGVYDTKKELDKADSTIHDYFKKIGGYQEGGLAIASSTGVHNNIDNLILQAELDKLAQTGSMRADTRPQYIGGVDPIVENIAMGPLLTLKSLGSVGKKIIEKTGLRNPVSHYTTGQGAANILKTGSIKGTSLYPGKSSRTKFKKFRKESYPALGRPDDWSASITRDPMFTSRPHGTIGTDIRFILDRDDLVKKGFPMKPIAVANYKKVLNTWNPSLKKLEKSMNPRFEFEERVRGNIPTENIKLIDILQLPLGESDLSPNMLKLLGQLSRTNIPIIKSNLVKNRLNKIPIGRAGTFEDVYKLMDTPTYRFDPFEKVR